MSTLQETTRALAQRLEVECYGESYAEVLIAVGVLVARLVDTNSRAGIDRDLGTIATVAKLHYGEIVAEGRRRAKGGAHG